MLGCTLEGNQLRHCAAKPIVQLAIIATQVGFYTSCALIQGPIKYELDALPIEPLGLIYSKRANEKNIFIFMFLYFIQRMHRAFTPKINKP